MADAEAVPTLQANYQKSLNEVGDLSLRVGQLESALEAEKRRNAEAADFVVAAYKSSRAFEEDVLVEASSKLRLIAMEWLTSEDGKLYMADLGEDDYHAGSLDM